MSSKLVLGAGLILVACLAGVYVYLDNATPAGLPQPDVTNSKPPATQVPATANDVDSKPPEVADKTSEPSTAIAKDPLAATKQPTVPVRVVSDEKGPAKAKTPAKIPLNESDKPLLDGWKDPAAVVVLTGEMHGYVEPCGCAIIQLGGLARRDDLLRQIREERKWPATAFDLGGLMNRPHRTQAGYKIKFAFDALKDMKYPAVAIGVEELKMDIGAMVSALLEEKHGQLDILGTNITSALLGEQIKPYVVTTVGKTKIAATTVFGKSLKAEFFTNPNSDTQGDYTYRDPIKALSEVVPKIVELKPDLKILLAHASMEEATAYAKKFPQFDLVLGMGPEDPDPKPSFVGKTMVTSVGHKGKSIGVLGYFPEDSAHRLRWELVKLDPKRFKNSPRMEQHMRDYQEVLKQTELSKNLTAIAHPDDSTFVGAAKCGECHKQAYAVWKDSKHANATESLKTGRKGQEKTWINRVIDAECISCHVTGWHPQEMVPYKSGYIDEIKTPHLKGQQCENCHGPGGRHVELEEAFKKAGKKPGEESKEQLDLRKKRHRTLEFARKQLCVQCHDHDNSPEFEFDKYWNEIAHPGKD